jgi:hypothetical protein
MSAAFFEMIMKSRVARPVEDLDGDTLKAIANSSVASSKKGRRICPASRVSTLPAKRMWP